MREKEKERESGDISEIHYFTTAIAAMLTHIGIFPIPTVADRKPRRAFVESSHII